jgi:hypothetical protein
VPLETAGLTGRKEAVMGSNELTIKPGTFAQDWMLGRTKEVLHHLRPVIQAMDQVENIGNPSDADYLVIMESIANEARRRAELLKSQLGANLDKGDAAAPDDAASTTFTIELVVGGDPRAAQEAVEAALDDGVLQDAINDYESDDGEVEVLSAVVS